MSKNLFVGNLSFRVTEDELQTLFSNYGQVSSVRIVKDRDSGLSRGFGFVEMPDSTEATTAIEQLNGHEVLGRAIRVNEAQAKPDNRSNDRTGGRQDNRRSFRSRY
jgi:RNA recognition motif-containing protein